MRSVSAAEDEYRDLLQDLGSAAGPRGEAAELRFRLNMVDALLRAAERRIDEYWKQARLLPKAAGEVREMHKRFASTMGIHVRKKSAQLKELRLLPPGSDSHAQAKEPHRPCRAAGAARRAAAPCRCSFFLLLFGWGWGSK